MFHVKHEGLGSGARSALESYLELLRDKAVPIGAVAEGDRDRLWVRHIEDCLRAAQVVGPEDHEALDLGSGAGLPGVVVAIARPALHVRLVEARQRRVAFLELVVDRLRLSNATVVPGRAEAVHKPADLCFARAFGDPSASWTAADRLLRPRGRLVYFAGARFDAARDVPVGVSADVVADRPLERFGPLVIMTRQ
jgi:16S rRNA (guanine527-N7)-methyltransferase